MPRMPTAEDLPVGSLTSRQIVSQPRDHIGPAVVRLGNTISDEAARDADKRHRQDGAIDLARANADWNARVIAERSNYALDKDQDYATWRPRFSQAADKHREAAANLIRDPEMRAEFKLRTQDDLARHVVDVDESARGIDRERREQEMLYSVETNLKAATTPGIKTEAAEKIIRDTHVSLEQAFKTGVISPAQYAEARTKFPQRYAFNLAARNIESDPATTLRWLTGNTRVANADPSLLSIIRTVESGNRADAISSKGAAGLFQIMPATGQEIAQELGDRDFPVSGSTEEMQRYLLTPDVSERYGEHYLNKMLTKYGGDLRLALAAYNWGPGKTDAWLAKGGDPARLPAETRDYIAKITKAYDAEAGPAPKYYEFLDPEDRLRLASAAVTATAQADAAAQQARRQAEADRVAAAAQRKGELDLDIEEGFGTREAILSDGMIDDGDKAVLLRRLDEKADDQTSAGQILQDIQTGAYVDPDRSKKGLNHLFKESGGADGLITGADNQKTFATLAWLWGKGNVLPTDAKGALQGMLRASDGEKALRSFAYLDNLQKANPTLFQDTFDETTEKAVAYYQDRVGFDDGKTILDGWRKHSDPAAIKLREPLLEQGKKEAATYDANKVTALFDQSWWSDPASPKVPENAAALEHDFREFYAEAWAETADKGKAEARAVQRLSKKWGVSEVNGGMLMQYPPEKQRAYPAIDGSHKWMTDQLESDLKALGYVSKYSARGRGEVTDVRSYLVTPSPLTEAEIAARQPPHYNVVVLNPETGEWDGVLDKNGVLLAYRWDATGPLILSRENENRRRARDQARKRGAATTIKATGLLGLGTGAIRAR